ncbi:MAG: hypothetical protein JJT76_13755 [Clostridiaceae bacterium]|nr:hypothetical protein [Clostridiaceae bacterium]
MIRESELIDLPVLTGNLKESSLYIRRPIYSPDCFTTMGFVVKDRRIKKKN